jgi:hypothetical protein
MEYLDSQTADANIDLLFDQGERDGMLRTVDFDVIVWGHVDSPPGGEDVGFRRKRLKAGARTTPLTNTAAARLANRSARLTP